MFVLNSCNGQKKENSTESIKSDKKLDETELNTDNNELLFFQDYQNQISRVVRTIYQDSKGFLWFGTENGAFKLEGDSLTHIDGITSENGQGITIKEITESNDGKIWFGHTDGVSSIEENIVTNYYESDGLISNDVWAIASSKNGDIWIGTIKGVCIFNGETFRKFNLPEGKIDSTLGVSSKEIVHDIFQDSEDKIWMSSNAGLFLYADTTLVNVSKKVGIQTNFINEVFEDTNGTLWISTKEGLYNLINSKATNVTKGKIEKGKVIGSIAEDKDGNIWFVGNQHFLFTIKNDRLTEFKKTENNKGPVVFEIYKDLKNRLWFVGAGGAFRLENEKFISITKNGPW